MKRVLLFTVLLSAFAFAKKKEPIRPVGFEASFVEAFSPTEIVIKSSGIGKKPELAEADIPRVALQFVLFQWTDKLVSTAEEKQKAELALDEIYGNPTKFITWIADKVTATRRLPDDRYEVVRMVRINKGALQEYLQDKGVLSSREDLAADVGNPILMVIPDAPKGVSPLQVFETNPLAQQCAGAIESFLTARQYDVQVPKGQDQLNNQIGLLSTVKGVDEDPAYQIALSTGADIYLTFAGAVDNVSGGRKASLVIKAFETTTARLLGTETGYSQTRPNTTDQVLVEEATNDAIDKVLQRITNYWKQDARRGLQYRVVLRFANLSGDQRQDLTDDLDDLMSEQFKDYKENVSTEKTADYLIWAPRSEFKNSNAVSKVFRKTFEKPGIKVKESVKNRKLLLLDVTGN